MLARLSRHMLLLLVSNVGGAGLSFLLSILIGRALGSEGLGEYAVVLAWVYPLSLLVEFGLGTLATRDLAREVATSAAYLHTVTRARLLLGGIAMLALLVLAPLLSSDPVIVTGLVVSAPMVILVPFTSAFTAVFKARGAMYPIPWLNIGMLVAQVLLTSAVLAAGGGVVLALAVNTLTSLGQLIAAWAIWRWRFHTAVGARAVLSLGALLRRAFPFALAGLFAALQIRLSILLLENLATTADVGAFAAANRFVEAARLVPNAFFGALLPALATLAAQPDALHHTFRRSMLGLSAFGLAAGVGISLLAPWLVTSTYGEGFAPAVPVLQVLVWSLVFNVLRGGRTLYWYALGREMQVNVVNGAVILLQIALSLALIPPLGAVGAALGMIAVEAAALALLWREIRLPARWSLSDARP